jgi:RNA-directed DNA polymerase
MTIKKPRHPIDQSTLYNIRSKKDLAEILQFNLEDFEELTSDKQYKVFENKKNRWIQCPINDLRPIHDRLQNYLKRIKIPDYVHSQSGRSYITNALSHSVPRPFAKTDISKFYPSTDFSTVYNLFNNIFKCAPDVAWHLAKLCCYRGRHLPTGSPISGSVAFLAYQPMFDRIERLASTHDCVFTLFVDDLGISGFAASKAVLYEIRGVLRSHGLDSSNKKSKTFGLGRPKKITGVLITTQGPQLPNRRQLKIHRLKSQIQNLPANDTRSKLEKSLQGSLQEASEIQKANDRFKKKS